jgi:hypothetical protein
MKLGQKNDLYDLAFLCIIIYTQMCLTEVKNVINVAFCCFYEPLSWELIS